MPSEFSTVAACFVVSQEIKKHRKPFGGAEYVKDCFIKIVEHLFKNENDINK